MSSKSDPHRVSIRRLLNWSTDNDESSSEVEFQCWQTPVPSQGDDSNNNGRENNVATNQSMMHPIEDLNEYQKAVMKINIARESTRKRLKKRTQ